MTETNAQTGAQTGAQQDCARKEAWVRPEVTKIKAGDAEFGATPLVPEGPFAFGS